VQMDKTLKPLISVVMSVFNSELYVKEAIDSILNQTFEDFEFIILDDGSTDKSVDIIQGYTDSRIRFFQNDKNLGLRGSLNRGLQLAEGKYIARMDSDDIAVERRFEIQVKYLEQHPDVVMCGGNVHYLIDGKIKRNKEIFPCSFQEIRIALLRYNCFFHPTVMLRTDFIRAHELYYQRTFADDYDLWTRMMNQSVLYGKQMINLPEVFLNYRLHSANFGKRKKEIAKEVANIQKEYVEALDLQKEEKDKLIKGYTGQFSKIQDISETGRILMKYAGQMISEMDNQILFVLSKHYYELCYMYSEFGISVFHMFCSFEELNHVKLKDKCRLFIKCVFRGKIHRLFYKNK
jgi:glycosyltransferase involved in cell wall biosynthesis